MTKSILNFQDFFVGCTDWHDTIRKTFKLPFNVIKQENKLIYELGFAGFSKDDIEVTLEPGIVYINASKQDNEVNYLYKGLSYKKQKNILPIPNLYEIEEVNYKNGILKITFSLNTQETKKIDIKEEEGE